MADQVSKSWFAVFNNPRKHGYEGEPEEILNRLMSEWCCTDTRVGAWAYCIKHYCGHYEARDDEGNFLGWRLAVTEEEKKQVPEDLHHVHMVLEDQKAMRFSVVKNTYALGMHFEGTKGSKKEAEDYIAKTGKYDEKPHRDAGRPWEEIIKVLFRGEIKGRQGQRSDIETIERMIRQDNMTPQQIFDASLRYQRHRTDILADFFRKRDKETPSERQVDVYWHTGKSGSGKSYVRIGLEKQYGPDEVFVLTGYDERGMFDGYYGQRIMIMDEFKGAIPFFAFLNWTDKYKYKLSARYFDRLTLWDQVHIASIYHPLGCYHKMISGADEFQDPVGQMYRRIKAIIYHWKDSCGYHCRAFPPTYSMAQMEEICTKGLPDEASAYLIPEGRKFEFTEISSDEEI